VRVVSLRRQNGRLEPATDELMLEDGDTLVLSGQAETLALAKTSFEG
jgi:CPA2 family monovalent cation:H+ antiporter-2